MRSILLSLLVCGCSFVDATTAYKLSKLDPLTADPAGFAVAIMVPEEIDIPPKETEFVFEWSEGDIHLGGPFTLDRRVNPPMQNFTVPDGMVVYHYDLPATAVDEIAQMQRDILISKSIGKDGDGSLTITTGACLIDDVVIDNPQITVLLRIEQDGEFLPIMHDADLETLLSTSGYSELESC